MYKGMVVAILMVNALFVAAFALPPPPPNSMANIFATPAGQNSFMNFFSTSPNSSVTGATPSQSKQPPLNKPSNPSGTAAPNAPQAPVPAPVTPSSNN